MKLKTPLRAVLASFALTLPMWAAAADAPAFQPTKPLRIIAPSSPGGILDQTSRLLGKGLSDHFRQPVIIENLPGAGGVIGVQAMLRAEPDGYTMVMGSLGPNAANYALHDKLPYAYEDLAPVAQVLSMPDVLVVNPKLPARTIAELKRYAASRPGGLSMAVSTSGSSGHLAGALLKQRAGINAVDVVYRGAAPALTDLVGGQVDFMVDNLITALPLIRAGKLRAIAVTTKERSPELPDTPTVMEAGYEDFDVSVWLGLFVSSKTPQPVVQALNAAVNKALSDPAMQKTLAQQGGQAVVGTPADFGAFVQAEKTRWAQVIQTGNIKSE
ncbi:tripartite tricarboxylate transporter substrate binding protein [Achromobacter sp. UMC46]|uniref:Bug family tripartite tricarboxylate transporter substrate binding protein n=1 Tax=Achromobacter sp. UMC46 TaxID=1862319 RepID=UPI001600B65E|nr:tripartite tricarboxylate transporter substrate binding protein [Achromobacter sp. UMC46]MBB1594606.1 ABC transporter substrate-binding protein [Achromobacter sp. UMC46]